MRKSSDLVCRYIMASISFKREDWNAIDPVRDVKFLAEAILKEEERRANAPGPAVKNDLTPELVAKLLPPEMRVIFCGTALNRTSVGAHISIYNNILIGTNCFSLQAEVLISGCSY